MARMPDARRGAKTSEWRYSIIITVLIAIVESLIQAEVFAEGTRWSYVAAAVMAGLYALSRGLAKAGQDTTS